MEERNNISVSLEEAVEWYHSGNTTLRALALKAYPEEKLRNDFRYIKNKVNYSLTTISVPKENVERFRVLSKLAILAKYFNGNWVMETGKLGYFLTEEK